MPRHPKPWFRKSRGLWYVEIAGKQYNLGADRHEAFCRYHQLRNQPKRRTAPAPNTKTGWNTARTRAT